MRLSSREQIFGWLLVLSSLGTTYFLFILVASWPIRSGHGLSATYTTYFEGAPAKTVTRVETSLDFRSRSRLAGIAMSGRPSQASSPRGLSLTSLEASWQGTIDIPLAKKVVRESSLPVLMRIYAGDQFFGKPIVSKNQELPHFDVRDSRYGALPSKISIEWLGVVGAEKDATVTIAFETDGEAKLYLDDIEIKPKDGFLQLPLLQRSKTFRLRYTSDNHLNAFMQMKRKVVEPNDRPLQTFFLESSAIHQSRWLELPTNSTTSMRLDSIHALGDPFQHTKFIRAPTYGRLPISVLVRRLDLDVQAALVWCDELGERGLVPTAALHQGSHESSVTLSEAILFSAIFAISVLALLFLGTIKTRFFLSERKGAVAFLAFLVVATVLRFHNYDVFPALGTTRDEFNEAWIGWSLLHHGVPTGWSLTPAYSNSTLLSLYDREYPVVSPAFHPPPLFPLLLGVAATIGGARELYEVALVDVRIVPIICSILSIGFVWLISRKIWGERGALLSVALLATLPSAVACSRLAKTENLLILFFLGMTWCFLKYREKSAISWLVLAAVTAGLAAFTKPTGVGAVASLLILLFLERRYVQSLIAGCISGAIFMLYPLFGALYDWQLFLKVFTVHSSMVERFDVAVDVLRDNTVVSAPFGAGWIVWIWLALGAGGQFEKCRAALVPLLCYFATVALSVDSFGIYGWYRIPIFALLAICIGGAAEKMWNAKSPFAYTLFVLCFLGTSLTLVVSSEVASQPGVVRTVVLLLMSPLLFKLILHPLAEKIETILVRAVCILAVVLNSYISWHLEMY